LCFFLGRAGRSAERLIADAEITHGNHPRFSRLYRTFQCLAVPRQPLKLLETLETRVLKRLASAVQLRPWPPHFQSLTLIAFAFGSIWSQFTTVFASIGCSVFLLLAVDSRARTAGRCSASYSRVAHLSLGILHVGTHQLEPRGVRGAQAAPVNKAQSYLPRRRLNMPAEDVGPSGLFWFLDTLQPICGGCDGVLQGSDRSLV
jgi:hypothetical protein